MHTPLRPIALMICAGLACGLARASGLGSMEEQIRTDARAHLGAGSSWHECAACRAASAGASTGDERGRIPFDEASGRRLANYPPHRPADFQHMRLEISIEDMNRPTLSAVQTLTLTPVGWPLAELALDARGLRISRVESSGHAVSFEHDNERLRVRFEPPAAPGAPLTLKTTYTVDSPPAGLIWTPESPAWPGRAAQIHTQGQPETNSYWFPCHDFPNERLTTELRVSVPQGYQVCSNGRLAAHDRVVRTTRDKLGSSVMIPAEAFHWVQDEAAGGDHVNYLVSMVVGKFDVVDVGSQALPMPVYVPRGRGGDVPGTFGRTGRMAEVFGDRFAEPYPWAKYAQCVVWNFAAGGMENTSATTLYDTAVVAEEAQHEFEIDGLISHELAHQWFGDLITCRSWEHIWLNEGFATYCSALWAEGRAGPEGGREAYEADVRGYFDGIIAADKPDAPYSQGMVSKAYDHPWETFRRAANPYGKGASVLHMLRTRLGDQTFFRGISLYVDRFRNRDVETSDLRKTLEEVSGESLEHFFAQWCYRPGVPTLSVEPSYDAGAGVLRVDVLQVQNIDADNPAFEFTLPVWVGTTGGEGEWFDVRVDGRKASATFPLAFDPEIIAVDPGMAVLAGLRIGLSPERWVAQFQGGPTFASRIQAARALGALGGGAAQGEIGSVLFASAMDRAARVELRLEAVRALAAMRDATRVETLAAAQLSPVAVREAAVRALGEVAAAGDDAKFRARAVALLSETFERETSAKTRAAAIAALGALEASDRRSLIVSALRIDSHDDVVRQAAIRALADLGTPGQAAAIIEFTREGVLNRTRARAAETLGRVSAADRSAAIERLAELLSDREVRVRAAARGGLVELADARGLPALERAATALGDADRADARACIRRLRDRLATTEADANGG